LDQTTKEENMDITRLESADRKLGKAVFDWLDALSEYEETTDVGELARVSRQAMPDIIISKSMIEAWQAFRGRDKP
jgi:hypothetical protein